MRSPLGNAVAHAAQADAGDLQAGLAEVHVLHRSAPVRGRSRPEVVLQHDPVSGLAVAQVGKGVNGDAGESRAVSVAERQETTTRIGKANVVGLPTSGFSSHPNAALIDSGRRGGGGPSRPFICPQTITSALSPLLASSARQAVSKTELLDRIAILYAFVTKKVHSRPRPFRRDWWKNNWDRRPNAPRVQNRKWFSTRITRPSSRPLSPPAAPLAHGKIALPIQNLNRRSRPCLASRSPTCAGAFL